MPIPFFLAGAAILAAIGGTACAVGGLSDLDEAEKIVKSAEERYKKYLSKTEQKDKNTQIRASEYANQKNMVFNYILTDFIPIYERFKNVNCKKLDNTNYNISLTPEKLSDFQHQAINFTQVTKGLIGATSAGASAGLGALGIASLIGTASTGTALSSLAGVAATKATLAWFGGGSLATGGLGMVGGITVLGSIFAGPAIAIGGFMLAIQGDKALTEAIKYKAKVDKVCEQMNNIMSVLEAIVMRINEMSDLISKIFEKLKVSVSKLKLIPINKNTFSDEEIFIISKSRLLAGGLKSLLEVPIRDEFGNVSNESKKAYDNIKVI